jgi:hypothetical protein
MNVYRVTAWRDDAAGRYVAFQRDYEYAQDALDAREALPFPYVDVIRVDVPALDPDPQVIPCGRPYRRILDETMTRCGRPAGHPDYCRSSS